MKLAALGVITVAIGFALPATGLVGIGAFWVVMGLIVRTLAPRLTAKPHATPETAVAGEQGAAPDGRKFALGTLLLLAVGIPSLVAGLLGLGIDQDDSAWRWLPVGVGGLVTGFAVVSGLMYAAGAGVAAAAAGVSSRAQVPATLWIRSVKETGTFINERPRLEFVFLVQPDPDSGIAEFEVTKRATVPFTAMGSLRVGDGFRAQVVGPDDPESMTIDWDSPVGSGEPRDVTARLEELDRLRRDEKISDDEYHTQRERILGSL